MLALLLAFAAFAVAVLSLTATQVFKHLMAVLVGEGGLLHEPAIHHSRFEFGSPIFRACGMPTGHITGKVGMSETGDSHFGRW